ncbi:hypothetical protein Fleli_3162 [Bernardetia litoralis DSM 6794]|uniref:DUF4197 domain-containing protein n=1 Tax=Bernardetia litoralis (strain ATCC 23117 / DSM 6794 / NBRC 15988 / NCIMB 1366 / Fx l1 / Sio-4) TaxID=880071 RepID=I4ANG3_BERLS|nr:DUF4197 domain-containing protein [Bernardetia litoralis]AFM05498.1 hypothetical protein Fleli_3162 [Bernardetia litoralis DSM 6794]
MKKTSTTLRILSLFILISLVGLSTSCTTQQITSALGSITGVPLTKEEIASALKDALIQGVTKGTGLASQDGGYFNNALIKIPFPEDAEKVATKLRSLGLGSEVDKFVKTLNQGAEEAAKEAAPIFKSAITSMSIKDASAILKGDKDAATQYLIGATTEQLKAKFKPIMSKNLAKVNATRYYTDLVGKYNQIPFVTNVNPDLDDYATEKAIEGLFKLVAQEEGNIRTDISARSSELMKKVFAQAPQAQQ